jgi:ketosteroid isomerase-like protein
VTARPAGDLEGLVRRAFQAYDRGDLQTVLATLDDDVEVYSHPDTGNTGTYHGHKGFLQWVALWLDAWEEFRIEVREVKVLDDVHVLAVMDQFGRGRGSGIPVEQRGVAYLFTVRDGRTTFMGLYLNRDTALADLGRRA